MPSVHVQDVLTLEKANYGFECLGICSSRAMFHPHGYVVTGEIKELLYQESSTPVKKSYVYLFGFLHDIEMSQSELERLFNCARHRMCQLDLAVHQSSENRQPSFNFSSSQVDLQNVRRELREFFLFLRYLVNIESHDSDNAWVVEELYATIIQGLTMLRCQLGWLSNLPNRILDYSSYPSGIQPESTAAFHLFHSHLELRWLLVSVLVTVQQSNVSMPEYQSHSNVDTSILFCVWDLLEMALLRFDKMKVESVIFKSFYTCVCVKELWYLLKAVYETTRRSNEQSFWVCINHALEAIKQGEVGSGKFREWSKVLPSKLLCQDPIMASLWSMKHLAELFVYNDTSVPSCIEGASDNYSALTRILRDLTNLSSSYPEAQLQVILTLVNVLMTEIWTPKTDPIMTLWDLFSRLLDSAFQLPGAAAIAYTVPCDTPQDILNSVLTILETQPGKGKLKTSYDTFLSLLGNCLSVNPSLWKQKMRGRIYSKLSPKKVGGLSEMGLFHLTQLFLTIALKTDIEDATERFQSLCLFKDNVDDKKNGMILKAHLSFLFLYAQKNLSGVEPMKPLVSFVTKCTDHDKFEIPRMFASSMKDMTSGTINHFDFSNFVGKWIVKYLNSYHPDSGRSMLSALLSIMQSVERCLHLSGGNMEESMESLIVALWENVLPFIIKHMMEGCRASLPVADLAISFTFVSLYLIHGPMFSHKTYQFLHLVDQFLMTDSYLLSVQVTQRYLYLFLIHEKAKLLLEESEDLQHEFVKAWIRCCAMSTNMENEELKVASKKIFELTHVIQSITKSSSSVYEKIGSSFDPLLSLLNLLGSNMREVDDTSKYRKSVGSLLQPLERLARHFQQHFFPTKSKDENVKPEKRVVSELPTSTIMRGYHVLAQLVFDCGSVIYRKGMANSLLPQIVTAALLPTAVYNSSFRLPQAMNDALRKYLLYFLRGLAKLEPTKDKCIYRYMGDILSVYLPRMVMERGSSINPFFQIWDNPEFMHVDNILLQLICDTFLQIEKDNKTHPHYSQCLQVLLELVKSNAYDDIVLPLIIKKALPLMLEIIGKVTDFSLKIQCKEQIRATLAGIFNVCAASPTFWDVCNDVLIDLSKMYLMKNPELFNRILSLLKNFPQILKKFTPCLLKQIEVERQHGINVDKQLNLYEILCKTFN